MAASNAYLWAQPIVFSDDTGAPAFSHKVSAVFDNYDGAEDSSRHHNPQGYGATRYDAVIDLLMHLDDPEPCDAAPPTSKFSLTPSGIARLLAVHNG